MSNGLDDLAGRRRRRQTPPPKHPRSEQSELTEASPASPEPSSPPEETALAKEDPAAGAPPAKKTVPAPSGSSRGPAKEAAPPRSDAARARRTPSIEAYLDEELVDWLWQVESAAVAQRMRSVNSPVIRLALRRLQQQMSPEEIVRSLQENAPPSTGRPGRPRR